MAPMLSILAATCAVLVAGGASADPAPGKYFDKVLIMMFENVRSRASLVGSLSVCLFCLSVCLSLSVSRNDAAAG